MTTKRTDIHAPSSDSFDPEAYTCYGVFDNNPEFGETRLRQQAIRALVARGYKFGHGGSQSCGHCGAFIRYAALMVRDDVKEFIFVGETCLDNRFELTKDAFQELRKNAELNRDRMKRSAKVAALIEAYPFLTEVLAIREAQMQADFDGEINDFLTSIAYQVVTNGELSEKQLSSAEKALNGYKRFQAAKAAKAAEKAAQIASGAIKPAPADGRLSVTGEIVAAPKYVSNDFRGGAWKIIVRTAEGWAVRCSVPSALEDEIDKSIVKGAQVSMTVTIKASDDDVFFVWGTRPSKFTVL